MNKYHPPPQGLKGNSLPHHGTKKSLPTILDPPPPPPASIKQPLRYSMVGAGNVNWVYARQGILTGCMPAKGY